MSRTRWSGTRKRSFQRMKMKGWLRWLKRPSLPSCRRSGPKGEKRFYRAASGISSARTLAAQAAGIHTQCVMSLDSLAPHLFVTNE